MATSAGFSFTLEDGAHVVNIEAKLDVLRATFIVQFDNENVVQKRVGQWHQLNGKHLFKLGSHIAQAEVSGITSAAVGVSWKAYFRNAKFGLNIDGRPVPEGQHVKLVEPQVTISSQPPTNAGAQPQVVVNVQSQGNNAVVPTLPPNCPQCGAALNMNTVKWSGPLNAACPTCGNGIQVAWNKIG